MKGMTIVVVGALVLLLCMMPAMAKRPVDTEEGISVQETSSILADRPPDTAPADVAGSSGEPGVCGIDPQSPVLDGSAFTSYDTVFFHGTGAVTDARINTDIAYVDDKSFGHVTMLEASPGGYMDAWISCPIPSYDKKTGGVQPQVRYLGLYYASDASGVGWPEVDQIEVYNGCYKLKTITYSPAFHNSGSCSVQIIDLDNWYTFNRGLNLCVHIRSASGYDRAFTIGGYGARFEW